MKIKLLNIYDNKIRLLVSLLTAMISAIMYFFLFPAAAIWPILLFVASLFSFKPEKKAFAIGSDIILFIITAVFSLYFCEFINIVGHASIGGYHSLFAFINRKINYYDPPISLRVPTEMLLTLAVCFLLRIFLSGRVAAAIAPAPFLLVSTVNYYVYEFRGSELLFPDLFGAGTAARVASGYAFPVMMPVTCVLLPYILFILAVINLIPKKEKRTVKTRILPAALSLVSAVSFVVLYGIYNNDHPVYAYQDLGTQGNGFVLNFLMSATDLRLKKPDGYDTAFYSDMVNTGAQADNSDRPNIIVIMNESLADLSCYEDITGPFSEDPLSFIHSEAECGNLTIGYAQASVFGGRTANSEFEYLTGITTYGLPEGMIPYAMKVNHETYSLAAFLAGQGYQTTAMHPYVGSGWDRDKVYPLLGFERSVFIDEMSYDDNTDMINDYITDMCLYRNMLDIEAAATSGSPRFMFAVSIQNHGGYAGDMTNLQRIDYVDPSLAYAEETNNYLSLVHQSDEAFRWLTERLGESDEKYVVIMFGDHQPALAFNSSYTEADGRTWTIPYIIWANYDMQTEIATDDLSSINYLAIDTLQAAGIPLPPYFDFLSGIREDIPCINSAGYVSDSSDPVIQSDLDLISGLQYYALENR